MGEANVLNHFCHEHPLRLAPIHKKAKCHFCNKPVVVSELSYSCIYQCNNRIILHKRCAELMPKQIDHPSHPQHTLSLMCPDVYWLYSISCSHCLKLGYNTFRYLCKQCWFSILISCIDIDYILGEQRLEHPSDMHPLTLQKRSALSFHCDGCGTEGRDMAYVCNTCEFWVHKSCALLPSTIERNYHLHPLSLAFFFPIEHRKYQFPCDICNERLFDVYWIYYCDRCRFFAHVKCAIQENAIIWSNNLNAEDDDNDGSLIQLPVNDISKELIIPFIMRQNNFVSLPMIDDMPTSVQLPATNSLFSMLFNYHKHPLTLIKVDNYNETEGAELICDLCITPVFSPPYYSCAACKYFVHLSCYLLPKTLTRDPLYEYKKCSNHKLTLYSHSDYSNEDNPDRHLLRCWLCTHRTTGIAYYCQACKFTMDVKCASLPTTVKHVFHPHKLIKKTSSLEQLPIFLYICVGCDKHCDFTQIAYVCSNDECQAGLHLKCAMLQRSIQHTWDKHPLLLTHDAYIDHPSDFYCENCEEEIHPKRGLMYHCRECDNSFHVDCLSAGPTGPNRNIKFGRQFKFRSIHHHSLTYNLVSTKLKCDGCDRIVYDCCGFECASCNYALCESCGRKFWDSLDEVEPSHHFIGEVQGSSPTGSV